MKNILLVACFFLSQYAFAQPAEKDTGYRGFGKLLLGEPKSKFDPNIKWLAKYTKNDHEFNVYSYAPSTGELIEIVNIKFGSLLLIFNDSNNLIDCSMTKFYLKKDNPLYEKAAEADFKKITDYLAGYQGEQGEKKIYYRSSKWQEKGREWAGTKTFLKVKKKHTAYHSVVEINFRFPDQQPATVNRTQ